MARGRPPIGVGHVDRLVGDEETKERLRMILQTIAGEMTVEEACARLGIGASRFHEIRQAALQGALVAVEVGPPGRPRAEPPAEPGRVEELQAQVEELEEELVVQRLRTEIAVTLPHVLKVPSPEGGGGEKRTEEAQTRISSWLNQRAPSAVRREARHQARLRAALPPSGRRARRRHGAFAQRERRESEQAVRKAVVALARWMVLVRRASLETVATRLWVSPRTLRSWCHGWRQQEREADALGRKPSRGPRERRLAVLALLSLTGLHVGLPSLRKIFPELSRAELADLKRRMLRVRRRRGRVLGSELTWTTPGTVWAMDHAKAPGRIDGLYREMFMVRDLASSNQLDALPCIGETDLETCDRLEALFLTLGPPLVMKCDNGSAFRSALMHDLLNEYHVLDLLSPPYTPSHNGAIEAGNGSMKVRAHHEAARHGRPGEWTCDDLEAARLQANELGRPFGMNGPTPDEVWTERRRIRDQERTDLLDRTAECWMEDCRTRGYLPGVPIGRREADTMYRPALVRALIDKGFLLIGR